MLKAHAHAPTDSTNLGWGGIDGFAAAFCLADHGIAADYNGAAVNRFELTETPQKGALAAP